MATRKKYESLKEKFEDGYSAGNVDDCWNWGRGLTAYGYGQMAYKCKRYAPHRLSWEYANDKKIGKGMVIMHSCDNPSCVNPNHLSMGTQAENVADMIRKGRFNSYDRTGENNHSCVVKKIDVSGIFEAAGTHQEIADKFNYPVGAIKGIRNGKTWKADTKGLVKGLRGVSGPKAVMTDIVKGIYKASGTDSELAGFYLCSERSVKLIRTDKIWKHITSGLTKG